MRRGGTAFGGPKTFDVTGLPLAALIKRSFSMKGFVNCAKTFLKSEDGPTATEYAVMLALIIIVALGAITGLGTTVDAIFTNVDSSLPTGTSS